MNRKKLSYINAVRISWGLYISDILYFPLTASFFAKYKNTGLLLMAVIGIAMMTGTLVFAVKNCRCPHCGKYIIRCIDDRCPYCLENL